MGGAAYAGNRSRPAALVRDGGVIADGFDAELDNARDRHALRRVSGRTGGARAQHSGIANLKVEYNRVHGFYIEVTGTSRRSPTTTGAGSTNASAHPRIEPSRTRRCLRKSAH
jgi:DNA mismatch repair protein MutS